MFYKQYVVAAMFSLAVVLTAVPVVANAKVVPVVPTTTPLSLIGSPQETTGPFRYNNFHKATAANGTRGAVLGWFDLDGSLANSYDPDTGDLIANFTIYNDSGFGTPIGTAFANGSLPAGGFNGFSGGVIGTIDWAISLGTSDFLTYMQTNFGAGPDYNVMMSFLDVDYVTSTNRRNANTYNNGFITLWGGDNFDGTGFDTALLGVDMVVQTTPVPVSAAIWLFGSGLLVLMGVSRRRKQYR